MPISGSPEALPLSSFVALGTKTIRWVGGAVFGLAPAHPLAPHLERGGFHLLAHELDHLLLGKPELVFDRFKAGAVFLGHLDDAIELIGFKAAGSGVGQRLGRHGPRARKRTSYRFRPPR